jgi:hypothetical protein
MLAAVTVLCPGPAMWGFGTRGDYIKPTFADDGWSFVEILKEV